MKKIIDNGFQDRTQAMMAAGSTKYGAAKALGVSRPTIRRALAAWGQRIAAGMAQAGQGHCVYVGDVIPPPSHPVPAPAPAATKLILCPRIPAACYC